MSEILKFSGRIVRQKVMATLARGGGKRVENFPFWGLAVAGFRRTFASREMGGTSIVPLLANPFVNCLINYLTV